MVAQRPLLRRPQAPPGPRPLNHYDQHTFSTESRTFVRMFVRSFVRMTVRTVAGRLLGLLIGGRPTSATGRDGAAGGSWSPGCWSAGSGIGATGGLEDGGGDAGPKSRW